MSLLVIFTCAAHDTAHNNGCLFAEEGWMPLIQPNTKNLQIF